MLFTGACISFAAIGQSVPPLTSTISGVVWQESKPANGVRISSETKVAGILVKLLDATAPEGEEVLIASALSAADGSFSLKANGGTYKIEYVYPYSGFTPTAQRAGSDKTVNSAASDENFSETFTIGNGETVSDYGLGLVPVANTLTYCTQKPTTVTQWDENLLLPKSNVGTNPTNVKLYAAEAVFHPRISIENTGTATAYEISAAGRITMTVPIAPSTLTMNSNVSLTGELENYDTVEDYDGPSGDTFYNRASYDVSNGNRSTSNPTTIGNNFVGAETFSIVTKAQSSLTLVSGGNLKNVVETFVSAGACVVYTYPEGALPVTLVSFTAKKEGETVNLNWTTSEEEKSDRFEVERSADGKTWAAIGTVRAAGDASTNVSYNFSDAFPGGGQNLYRLKMIDLDQTFAYSNIRQVTFKVKGAIYPNPAVSNIQIKNDNDTAVQLVSIYNVAGQLVKRVSKSSTVDITGLSNGTYTVNAVYANGQSSKANILIAH